ncbi:MAG: hypothetical protein QG622_3522 [Actinomycetota bacterium]|nr:hypothetical protein [Actinomycetota bacterium]
MSWDADGPLDDDEPLARPFLTGHGPARARPVWPPPFSTRTGAHVRPDGGRGPGTGGEPADAGSVDPGSIRGEVRPYLLTGGRTRARTADVAMETIVVATGIHPVRVSSTAGQERLRIVQLASDPCSTAEVAAWLHLPLQVALVLVGDLIDEGFLDASRATVRQSEDVHFLERLIAGVAAL